MATLANIAVWPGHRDATAVLTRFALWGTGVFVLIRLALGRNAYSLSSVRRYAIIVGATGVAAGIAGRFGVVPAVDLRPLGALVMAAGIEEVVFRALLPNVTSRLLAATGRRSLLIDSTGLIIAQVSFAASHLSVSGGVTNPHAAAEFLRLFGCGCCSAVIYLVAGLFPAIMIHALANLVTLNAVQWQVLSPRLPSVVGFTVVGIASGIGALIFRRSSTVAT